MRISHGRSEDAPVAPNRSLKLLLLESPHAQTFVLALFLVISTFLVILLWGGFLLASSWQGGKHAPSTFRTELLITIHLNTSICLAVLALPDAVLHLPRLLLTAYLVHIY